MSLKPEAIIENTPKRTSELEPEGPQGTARAVTALVQAFNYSQVDLLILEKHAVPPQVGNLDSRSLTIAVDYRLQLESDQDVRPTGRSPLNQEGSAFVVCVRSHPSAEERLIRWKVRLTNMRVQPLTLGEFVGRECSYFLSREQVEHRMFLFEDPILSLTEATSCEKNQHRADINSIRPIKVHSRMPRNFTSRTPPRSRLV